MKKIFFEEIRIINGKEKDIFKIVRDLVNETNFSGEDFEYINPELNPDYRRKYKR